MRFHSFDDVQDHLDALGLFHMDFGLDRMRNALDALGLLTPPFVTCLLYTSPDPPRNGRK